MNITLTNNIEDRQQDKAMAMVGHAEEGAKKYFGVFAPNGFQLSLSEIPTDTALSCPWVCQSKDKDYYSVIIEDESLAMAHVHATEVMASFLED